MKYRPTISMLPILSKLYEKTLLKRINIFINQDKLISDHQFGFRTQHSTIEQVHRVAHKIRQSLEKKEYCSAVFVDIQQAFDRVWHKGLICKIKMMLPHLFYPILRSYLEDRLFFVKEQEAMSKFYEVKAGVPQGSVLGPMLYSLYTADLPTTPGVMCATFADDIALMSSSPSAERASELIQVQLGKMEKWLKDWKTKVSPTKSTHITFALKKGNCPSVTLNDTELPHQDSIKYLGITLDIRQTRVSFLTMNQPPFEYYTRVMKEKEELDKGK